MQYKNLKNREQVRESSQVGSLQGCYWCNGYVKYRMKVFELAWTGMKERTKTIS